MKAIISRIRRLEDDRFGSPQGHEEERRIADVIRERRHLRLAREGIEIGKDRPPENPIDFGNRTLTVAETLRLRFQRPRGFDANRCYA